jgi:hypothetical protein
VLHSEALSQKKKRKEINNNLSEIIATLAQEFFFSFYELRILIFLLKGSISQLFSGICESLVLLALHSGAIIK